MSDIKITNIEEIKSKRQKCEVWTRVMGYHRPVQSFNIGKKSEHAERKHFDEYISSNSCFCNQYA